MFFELLSRNWLQKLYLLLRKLSEFLLCIIWCVCSLAWLSGENILKAFLPLQLLNGFPLLIESCQLLNLILIKLLQISIHLLYNFKVSDIGSLITVSDRACEESTNIRGHSTGTLPVSVTNLGHWWVLKRGDKVIFVSWWGIILIQLFTAQKVWS